MRLTRRGLVVVLLIVTSILLGAWFGARGLNAIAAPAAVALIAAVVQVKRFDRPTVEREVPGRVQRGEMVLVRLHCSTSTPFSAKLTDVVDPGLVVSGNERETTIADGTFRYEVHAEERGEFGIGPVTIRGRDVLGLVTEVYRYPIRSELLVRPRVHLLAGPRRDDLVWLYGGRGDERGQFDQLRHYERGDPVRDIHWKSSAKQPGEDLVVREFTADEGTNVVQIAAIATAGCGDEMAEATASIASYLLRTGVRVGLVTPDGRVDAGEDAMHLAQILDHLAIASTGHVSEQDRRNSQVIIRATPDGVAVDLEGREVQFVDLAGRAIDTSGEPRQSSLEVSAA